MDKDVQKFQDHMRDVVIANSYEMTIECLNCGTKTKKPSHVSDWDMCPKCERSILA